MGRQKTIQWGGENVYIGADEKILKGAVVITIINIKIRCISWQTKLTSCIS